MSIVLYRVDERLIHGQVLIGWGNQLEPGRYLVVDDELATSEWERELYELSVSPDIEVDFFSTEDALAELAALKSDDVKSVLLTRDVATMLRLAEGGELAGVAVNLGGIYHAPGRQAVRPYLCLDDDDRERIGALARAGAEVTGQDLPSSPKVSLATLVGE